MAVRTIRGPTEDSDLGADVLECDACGLEVVIGDHRSVGHVVTLPDGWDKDLPTFPADAKGVASRTSSGKVLNAVAKNVPWLIGGSADLAPSTMTTLTFDGAGDLYIAESKWIRRVDADIAESYRAERYTLSGKGKGGLLGLAEGSADIVLSDLSEDTLLVFSAEGGASGGFSYHEDHDAWTCPEDQWLWPQSFDPDNRVMRYRGSPTVCNSWRRRA